MIQLYNSNYEQIIKKIQDRLSFNNRKESTVVREILEDIRQNGDIALIKYINRFESPKLPLTKVKLSQDEIDNAHDRTDDEMLNIIKTAIKNIQNYHNQFKLKNWDKKFFQNKSSLGMKITPIERVGVYVPGGTATYPSTVLMNVIPAQIAGVKEIALVTPSNKQGKINDLLLATAKELGIIEIYRMGGAQGIAALSYGTESVKPVYMIAGPGNIYVTLAKKEIFGVVGIDKLAGPSDICVVADKTSNPKYIAADLLAQAEHDTLASAILITDSTDLANKVQKAIKELYAELPRKEIMKQSLSNNSAIFLVKNNDLKTIYNLVNMIAPEHLEIFHKQHQDLLKKIKNAGAIFVGEYSAEVLGDYILGPNHVLPTGGTAKFSSPLSVIDFQKTSSIIFMNKNDSQKLSVDAAKLARHEDLPAHALAAKLRVD